jgi:CRISPR-associated protein Csx14
MTELRVPLDPCNPGQFFACCGLFELAGDSPNTSGQFVCSEGRPRHAEFAIAGPETPSWESLLAQLHDLTFEPPAGTEEIEESVRPGVVSPAGRTLELDWWLDAFQDGNTNLKCWAGQVTTRKLFEELPSLIDPHTTAEKLMRSSCMTKSKFGVDPRSAWTALNYGSSLNAQNRDAVTYPAVEVLAAIGLQGFRPDVKKRRGVGYSLWTEPLPRAVARLAAVKPWDGLPRFDYTFDIDKRGSYKYFTFGRFEERKAYYR